MRQMLMVLSAVALAGCQTTAEQASLEPAPANYRQIVAEHARRSFFDPYSVRDAAISAPRQGRAFVEGSLGAYERGWTVCVRANAKNRMGAYTGSKQTLYLIRGQAIVVKQDEEFYEVRRQCGEAQYGPFPEIEAGKPR